MWAQQYRDVIAKAHDAALCLVLVEQTLGSVPRERGAWMAVFEDQMVGTIGGGHLEFQAMQHAHELLAGGVEARIPHDEQRRYPLGPALGQCCGGIVTLRFVLLARGCAEALATYLYQPVERVALFGAGHVGRALIHLLSSLPYQLRWIDSRDAVFPELEPWLVQCEHSDPVQSAVHDLAPGSHVLVMSFSHAEDLEIVAQCLARQRERGDLGYMGLIGSKTKWARFAHRLRARGFAEAELARITCPIGIAGITGKEPEVIAVAVAAQLLELRSASGRAGPGMGRP